MKIAIRSSSIFLLSWTAAVKSQGVETERARGERLAVGRFAVEKRSTGDYLVFGASESVSYFNIKVCVTAGRCVSEDTLFKKYPLPAGFNASSTVEVRACIAKEISDGADCSLYKPQIATTSPYSPAQIRLLTRRDENLQRMSKHALMGFAALQYYFMHHDDNKCSYKGIMPEYIWDHNKPSLFGANPILQIEALRAVGRATTVAQQSELYEKFMALEQEAINPPRGGLQLLGKDAVVVDAKKPPGTAGMILDYLGSLNAYYRPLDAISRRLTAAYPIIGRAGTGAYSDIARGATAAYSLGQFACSVGSLACKLYRYKDVAFPSNITFDGIFAGLDSARSYMDSLGAGIDDLDKGGDLTKLAENTKKFVDFVEKTGLGKPTTQVLRNLGTIDSALAPEWNSQAYRQFQDLLTSPGVNTPHHTAFIQDLDVVFKNSMLRFGEEVKVGSRILKFPTALRTQESPALLEMFSKKQQDTAEEMGQLGRRYKGLLERSPEIKKNFDEFQRVFQENGLLSVDYKVESRALKPIQTINKFMDDFTQKMDDDTWKDFSASNGRAVKYLDLNNASPLSEQLAEKLKSKSKFLSFLDYWPPLTVSEAMTLNSHFREVVGDYSSDREFWDHLYRQLGEGPLKERGLNNPKDLYVHFMGSVSKKGAFEDFFVWQGKVREKLDDAIANSKVPKNEDPKAWVYSQLKANEIEEFDNLYRQLKSDLEIVGKPWVEENLDHILQKQAPIEISDSWLVRNGVKFAAMNTMSTLVSKSASSTFSSYDPGSVKVSGRAKGFFFLSDSEGGGEPADNLIRERARIEMRLDLIGLLLRLGYVELALPEVANHWIDMGEHQLKMSQGDCQALARSVSDLSLMRQSIARIQQDLGKVYAAMESK